RAGCVRVETSSRGAKRRGDPEPPLLLSIPGLLRFARNDGDGGVRTRHALAQACEKPQLARTAGPLRDHREALDLPALEGAQENVIGLERYAAVGIAVRAQHVGMREQPDPIEGEASTDRVQAQRLNAMKERLAQRELIDAGRRRAAIALIDEARVVY